MTQISKPGYVYIMTNRNRTTLYIGVTSDLDKRVKEHKDHIYRNSFTHKYKLEYCIYYESYKFIEDAINREKQLKGWTRKKKEELINSINPEWNTLL